MESTADRSKTMVKLSKKKKKKLSTLILNRMNFSKTFLKRERKKIEKNRKNKKGKYL